MAVMDCDDVWEKEGKRQRREERRMRGREGEGTRHRARVGAAAGSLAAKAGGVERQSGRPNSAVWGVWGNSVSEAGG